MFIKNCKILVLFAIYLIYLLSCSSQPGDKLDIIVSKSGENSKEILKAYDHFRSRQDSLYLDSFFFLVENMTDHSFSEAALYDSNRIEIQYNCLDHENYDEAIEHLDSLDTIHGELNWRLKKSYIDLETITADLLIENIEHSFEVWRDLPWSTGYSYNIFKEYILPYRGSSEPLESWRPYFRSLFEDLTHEMTDIHDPVEASILINKKLRSSFGFDPRFYTHPTDQGLNSMLDNRLGRCEDMTNFSIYALRANGIAVTSDYTPYWADSGNNHAWNVIITPDGRSIPFMGCEADPGEYGLRTRMAKAYRKIFSSNPYNLSALINNKKNIPPWLAGDNFVDVTSEYTPVSDVHYTLTTEGTDSTLVAYLCVFNSGEWKAIQWGIIIENEVIFSNMGTDLCYMPAFYINDQIQPAGCPFILQKDGSLTYLNGDQTLDDQVLLSVTKKVIEDATENKKISFLSEGEVYEYYYWENDWQLIGEYEASSEPLLVKDVPVNKLYWLVKKDSRKEERIFTYNQGSQIWW